MVYEDKFGILPTPVKLQFFQGTIYPAENYEEVITYIHSTAHNEGYLYPPIVHQEKAKPESFDSETGKYTDYEVIANSQRPSPVHYLPATHKLEVFEQYAEGGREKIGSFIIHLVAFLYGVRTQFHDWRIDGRALIKGRSDFYAPPKSVEKCISSSIKAWMGWGDDQKKRMTNILYLYTKAISEEYEWLEFTLLYMVFDACYHFAIKRYGATATTHEERMNVISNHFGIKIENDLFKEWVNLRNNLFHEALWRGNYVGTATFSDIYPNILYFHAFLARVITGLLSYDSGYIRSSWRNLGKICFD